MTYIKPLFFYFVLGFIFSNCSSENSEKDHHINEDLSTLPYQGKKTGINQLVVHELSDPDKLNPITSSSAGATYIEHNIFMYLLDVDKEKLNVLPWLAKSRPSISNISEGEFAGGLKIDYEIKKEARWDNGLPVTAHDVVFSFKATLNPHVDSEHQRAYIDFIKHVTIDKDNAQKFSFYAKEKNYAAEFSSGGTIYIIPEHIYDPNLLMRKYSIDQLSNEKSLDKIYDDIDLKQFAKEFNSEYFQREQVVGCGPYRFKNWKTGERIILDKKTDWWGEKYKTEKSFENHIDKITYEIISDQVTAVTAMKDEAIDLMRSVKPSEYTNLLKNKSFNEKYYLKTEDQLSYTYIGLNMKNEILQEKKIRKALAHLVDVPQIIDVINYGYAKEVASFVHPSKTYYNNTLKPYPFSLEKAVELIEEAGYTQFNSDGIRYKIVEGEERTLKFSIKYNNGNDSRENISLFLRENARKVGIDIEVLGKEWTVYLDECKNHQFDMYVLGWIQEAILDDPKQLFHTEMYFGGSNYVGFGDAFTDNLIDEIRVEMNDDLRAEKMKELQAIIHDEVPYIFLYIPENLIAVSKRFENLKTYVARPGYDERELKLQKNQ